MTFSDQTLTILVVVLLLVVLLLVVLVVLLGTQLARLRRLYSGAMGRGREQDVFGVLRQHGAELERLHRDVGVVHGNTETLRDLLRGAVSRVGVVRYDAFEDMGGQLSFSAALLDEHRNGIVLSSINGRSETRSYAKLVRDGRSEQSLSPEEEAAIDTALHGEQGVSRRVPRFRRQREARA